PAAGRASLPPPPAAPVPAQNSRRPPLLRLSRSHRVRLPVCRKPGRLCHVPEVRLREAARQRAGHDCDGHGDDLGLGSVGRLALWLGLTRVRRPNVRSHGGPETTAMRSKFLLLIAAVALVEGFTRANFDVRGGVRAQEMPGSERIADESRDPGYAEHECV